MIYRKQPKVRTGGSFRKIFFIFGAILICRSIPAVLVICQKYEKAAHFTIKAGTEVFIHSIFSRMIIPQSSLAWNKITSLTLSPQTCRPGSVQNAVDLYWIQIADRDTSLISWQLPKPTQLAGLECIIRTLVWDYDIWPWYVRNPYEAFWEGRKRGATKHPSARRTVIPALCPRCGKLSVAAVGW